MSTFTRVATVALLAFLAGTGSAAADPATIGSFILVNLLPGLIGTSGIAAIGGAAGVGMFTIGLGISGKGANVAVFRKKEKR